VIYDRAAAAAHAIIQLARRRRHRVVQRTAWLGPELEINAPADIVLGGSVVLERGVRLLGKVRIGDHTIIHHHVLLDAVPGTIQIGKNCSVNDYCVVYGMGGVTIGNGVRIATHTVIVSGNHNFENDAPIRMQGVSTAPIAIHDDVWIAANVTILAGVEIGRGAVIGAGSVVNRSVPEMSVAVGVPAAVIRKRSSARDRQT
jgi:acetyltransferase-like isoleucine patch superfamily enzyme